MQRSHWIKLARQHQQHNGGGIVHLLALCLQLPVEECVARAERRGHHATLAPGDAAEVISRMWAQWQQPTTHEGFHSVLLARSSAAADEMAAACLYHIPHPTAAKQDVEPAVHLPLAAAAGGAGQRQLSPAAAAAYQPPHQRQRLQQSQAVHTSAHASAAGGTGNIVPFPGRQGGQPPGPEDDLPRRHPWTKHRHDVLSSRVLDAGVDPRRPVLLFDANGVLTSHTSVRRSTGQHEARPGLHHLRRLLVGLPAVAAAGACSGWWAGRAAVALGEGAQRTMPALPSAQCSITTAALSLPLTPPPHPTPARPWLQPHYHIGLFSSASKKTIDVAVPLIEAAAGRCLACPSCMMLVQAQLHQCSRLYSLPASLCAQPNITPLCACLPSSCRPRRPAV